MLKIRFVRIGKKNKPFFRIAVGDSRRTPKGKFIEKLGYYNPLKKEKSVNKERVLYWLSQGAQCSDTVHNLLVSLEIIKGPKRKIKIKSKKSADAFTSAKATEDKKAMVDKPTNAEAMADKPANAKATADKPANAKATADKSSSAKATEDKKSADDKVVKDEKETVENPKKKAEEKKEEVKEKI